MQQLYSSDLAAAQWQGIEKLICVKRKSIWPLQRIVEAIFYLTKNGVIWRDLPEGFPPGRPFTGISGSGAKTTLGF